jgi:hypothetical protein
METETMRMLKSLNPQEVKEEPIAHALSVRKALATCNYGRFFKLYRGAPNMGGYLMDVFIGNYSFNNVSFFIDKHRILSL